ncbi:MAG: hypothetical protein ACXABO_15675 [Promethearchaeota archaeon]|jgi:hypothetical protein
MEDPNKENDTSETPDNSNEMDVKDRSSFKSKVKEKVSGSKENAKLKLEKRKERKEIEKEEGEIREREEREAKERAERESKKNAIKKAIERVEREAKDKVIREAKTMAEREVKEKEVGEVAEKVVEVQQMLFLKMICPVCGAVNDETRMVCNICDSNLF